MEVSNKSFIFVLLKELTKYQNFINEMKKINSMSVEEVNSIFSEILKIENTTLNTLLKRDFLSIKNLKDTRFLSYMNNLKVLSVTDCVLTSNTLLKLTKLKEVEIVRSIKEIPNGIAKLKKLFKITLLNNGISEIPKSIYNANINSLNLFEDGITTLPDGISKSKISNIQGCRNLEQIPTDLLVAIQNKQFTSIPFTSCKNLPSEVIDAIWDASLD